MERASAAVVATAVLLFSGAAPLVAQGYRTDLGINGGGQYYTPMLKTAQVGPGASSVSFAPGWRLGAQGTLWLWDRIGVRADFGYSEGKIKQSGKELASHINLWDGMGGLVLRLARMPDEWRGVQWLPYLTAGAGIKVFNPATNTSASGKSGVPFDPSTTNASNPYFLQHRTQAQFQAALGTDLRVSRHLAFRLEAGDRAYDTPVFLLRGIPGSYTLYPSANSNVGDYVHELYGMLGVQVLMGVKPAPRAIVTTPSAPRPTPAPRPPAPRPAPAPTPPSERSVSVCIVDPSVPQGTKTLSATYRPATGDTLVQGRPLAAVVPTISLASNAAWYMAGRPMTVTIGRHQWQYVTYGGPRVVDADEVSLLGTVGGLPVYAGRSDVSAFWSEWRSARAAAGDQELHTLLNAHPDLAKAFQSVQILYVPIRSVGCIFQGLQQLEQVRKVPGK